MEWHFASPPAVRSPRWFQRALPLALACAGVSGAARAQTPAFDDVTWRAGLVYPPLVDNAAFAAGDFDGDGWLDLVQTGNHPPILYRNLGADVAAGKTKRLFADVSGLWLPAGMEPASMALFGDLDNDGDQDLVVVRHHFNAATGTWNESDTSVDCYRNTGTSFVLDALPPDLGRWNRGHGGLALADMDVDGDLDVVFVHKGAAQVSQPQGPGFYLRNDGMPNLVDATVQAAGDLATPRRHLSLVLADFSGDLLPDLHTSVDFFSDYHCWNTGGGVLTDVTTLAGTTHQGSDMGLAVGDIENDGDLDIFSTNIDEGVLYLNDGAGLFTNDAAARGVQQWPASPVGWGTAFVDTDHDGDEDLVFVAQNSPGVLYENDGSGHFSDASAASALDLEGRSLVQFDYDRDGDLDLLIADTVSVRPKLFESRASQVAGRHWLVVDPVGKADNRDGIGARIRVQTAAGVQTRWMYSGASFHAGSPTQAHFGLGSASTVQEVRITWPSGQLQTLMNVPADQILTVTQP